MRRITTLLAASFLALLTLTGCGALFATPTPPPQPTPIPTTTSQPGMIDGVAPVDTVEIRILESMPVQVQAVVNGYLPNPCTKISTISQSRDGNTFNITIATTTEADKACIDVIEPYTQNINLEVAGLSAGTYTVTVNGVSATFDLATNNVAP